MLILLFKVDFGGRPPPWLTGPQGRGKEHSLSLTVMNRGQVVGKNLEDDFLTDHKAGRWSASFGAREMVIVIPLLLSTYLPTAWLCSTQALF
jgi:hypothetical protein